MQLPIRILVALLLCSVTACKDEPLDATPDAGTPDAGDPPPAPTPELLWRAENHGEAFSLSTADLDGDGTNEIIHAGRDLAVFGASDLAANTPRWEANWAFDGEYATLGGDNDWAYDARAVGDIDGDGTQDIVAVTSFLSLIAFSDADGHTLWERPLESTAGTPTQLAIFDADDDGVRDVFVAASSVAYSGKTGAVLWNTNLPRTIVAVLDAQLDEDPARELVVAIERAGMIGGPPRPPGPMLYAYDNDGEELFAFTASSDQATALDVFDLDGDGIDEAIVMAGSEISVVDAEGTLRFSIQRETFPQVPPVLTARVVDGAARIFLALLDMETGPRVEAWNDAGALVWSETLDSETIGPPNAILFVAGTTPRLLVGTGQTSPATGAVIAFDPGDAPAKRYLWDRLIGFPIEAFALTTHGGDPVVVAGGQTAALVGLHIADGTQAFAGISGSFIVQVATGDLDGDGRDEFVSVDDHGYVRALNAGGTQRWAAQLDLEGAGAAHTVAVADIDGDGKAEVLAGGASFANTKDPGVLRLFRGDGSVLATFHAGDAPSDVTTADLDADGTPEIVAAFAPVGLSSPDPCRVLAFDTALVAQWSVPAAPCFSAHVAVGELDANQPGPEIAYADVTLFTAPHVGLFTRDGNTLWNIESGGSASQLTLHAGGIYVGGGAIEGRGRLAKRSVVDGSLEWEAQFDGRQATDTAIEGNVLAFDIVPDRNADGVDEFIVGLGTGEAALLDGATRTTVWKQLFEDADLVAADRHTIGAVAYVPAHASHRDLLVVGHGAMLRMKSSAFAVDFDGTVLATVPMHGEARSIAVGRGADGRPFAALGAGLDVYGIAFSR